MYAWKDTNIQTKTFLYSEVRKEEKKQAAFIILRTTYPSRYHLGLGKWLSGKAIASKAEGTEVDSQEPSQ